MFSKESQYINAIKYTNQLKINYKKLNNDDIVEANSSTFITKDDILGRDIATKINNHCSLVNDTFISTLLIADETKLIKKDLLFSDKDYEITSLNSKYNIAISKNNLFETKNYFEKCGIDYIFSAYHILNLHIEQNPCNNNLVVLLFNDQAFCVVLNGNNEIVFNKKISLSAFDDIKKSKFYENEVLGQKLFDEVYYLELHELIKNTIEEFYLTQKNLFIEKISLLYNIKILTNDQIELMSNDFMIDVRYHPISVDEELFELSKGIHKNKSFIKPRIKPTNTFRNFLIVLTIFIAVFTVSIFILPYKQWLGMENKKEKIITEKVIDKRIILPDHVKTNNQIKNRIFKTLELIPYDMVLNKLTVDNKQVLLDVNMLHKDTYIKVIKPELLNEYKDVKIDFTKNEESTLKAIVRADNYKDKKSLIVKEYNNIYSFNEFISIVTVTQNLEKLFPKGSKINFRSSSKENYITFNYIVNMIVKSPLEFFSIIESLNKEKYSINIDYPLNFVKTNKGISIEFELKFNQAK